MNEQEVVRLLQYYRHDLMNELQIIHGYLSLDKVDKVKSKVEDVIINYNEERKLMNTNATRFILWVLQINQKQANIRLTYKLNFDHLSLQSLDEELVDYCDYIINGINIYGDKQNFYEVKVKLTEDIKHSCVNVKWVINGPLSEVEYFKEGFGAYPVSLEKRENQYIIECLFDI